jgi:hypothetical protein
VAKACKPSRSIAQIILWVASGLKEKKRKRTQIMYTAGMDQERMLFCVLHHPMDAETHNISPGELKQEELFSGNQVIVWFIV